MNDKDLLEKKAQALSGKNYWESKDIPNLNLESLTFSDGPTGIRKQVEGKDNLGINQSLPAILLPSPLNLGQTWSRECLFKAGKILGQEAKRLNVDCVLAPAMNLIRSLYNGRSFEYYSSSPYLTGVLASSFVDGLHDENVGSTIKHFALNNQETARVISNSVCDLRALHEIYLKPFKMVVTQSKPTFVMGSYNLVNNEYALESSYLLKDVLRDMWGYENAVITDWGALNNKILAHKNGLALEMPFSSNEADLSLVDAVRNYEITEEDLDERIKELKHSINSLKTKGDPKPLEQDALLHITEESFVLLKNTDNFFPMTKEEDIQVIGYFFLNPRVQGSGSARINPIEQTSFKEVFDKHHLKYTYFPILESKRHKEHLNRRYFDHLDKNKKILLILGNPDFKESEGSDRKTLRFTKAQEELLSYITSNFKNIGLLILNGGPLTSPTLQNPNLKGLFYGGLPGMLTCEAFYYLLTGKTNPSGRLSFIYPKDETSLKVVSTLPNNVLYKESVLFKNVKEDETLFPFGYGLSYKDIIYEDIVLKECPLKDDKLSVEVTLKNPNKEPIKEVIQIYLKTEISGLNPLKLIGFSKIELKSEERKIIAIPLSFEEFKIFDIKSNSFRLVNGKYQLEVGKDSKNILKYFPVEIDAEDNVKIPEVYLTYQKGEQTDDSFLALPGVKLLDKEKEVTMNSPLLTLKRCYLGFILFSLIIRFGHSIARNGFPDKDAFVLMISYMPLRTLKSWSNGHLKDGFFEFLLKWVNGHRGKAIKALFKRKK